MRTLMIAVLFAAAVNFPATVKAEEFKLELLFPKGTKIEKRDDVKVGEKFVQNQHLLVTDADGRIREIKAFAGSWSFGLEVKGLKATITPKGDEPTRINVARLLQDVQQGESTADPVGMIFEGNAYVGNHVEIKSGEISFFGREESKLKQPKGVITLKLLFTEKEFEAYNAEQEKAEKAKKK